MDKKETQSQEELNKSIDLLVDELFAEKSEEQPENVEKSIDIAQDSKTTADAAVNQAPKAEKDEARGAGRPAQISDVPQVDQDGSRDKQYDAAISERDGVEDENEEAKKQANSIDQTSDKGRMADKPAAPKMAPFKKSESGEEVVEVSKDEYEAYQAFKKSQEEAKKQEELKKAERFQADLIKSAVTEAVSGLKAENEELRKSMKEQSELLKAFANKPQQPKSITGIEALEKSVAPEDKSQYFTKSEMLDAAEELVKSGSLTIDDVIELENTGSLVDSRKRVLVEKKLHG